MLGFDTAHGFLEHRIGAKTAKTRKRRKRRKRENGENGKTARTMKTVVLVFSFCRFSWLRFSRSKAREARRRRNLGITFLNPSSHDAAPIFFCANSNELSIGVDAPCAFGGAYTPIRTAQNGSQDTRRISPHCKTMAT